MFFFPFGRPAAFAPMSGGDTAPDISGIVSFFPYSGGSLVVADLAGLPHETGPCSSRVFGFHIHEGAACTGAGFAETQGHYDPNACLHPSHAGDLPPLFGCGGKAYLAVFTNRFQVPEVIGRTVVIHDMPDDFTSQPSGHSGTKIACGVIRRA